MVSTFINTIILHNFKCYKHLEITLKAGVNILYGVNGTGKTSVLEAINIAAGSFFMRLSGVEKREIERSDIHLATLSDMPSPQYQFPVEIEGKGVVLGEQIEWKRTLNTIAGGITSVNAKDMARLSEDAASFIQNGEAKILPIITYFSTQRLFTQRKDSGKQIIGRLTGYYNALNATNSRKYIQSWFKDAEYEQYQKQQSDKTFINEGLEGIKALLLSYFPEWHRIYYFEPETDTRLEKGLFIVYHNGTTIPEGLLSDGYRNFLWLLIEIAWRCYMLNPFLGKDAFQKTNGIVTIDEIDLHLHPIWQQKITHILASAFPNIQFVITTHSPIILSSVKANVIKLEGNAIKTHTNLYGMKPSYILEFIMQTKERLPWLNHDIEQYFALIKQGKGKESEALLLRQKLSDDISQEDTLFTEADALIDFFSY